MSNKKKPTAPEILEIAASEMTYLPSPEQRRAKSAFWTRFNDNPICAPADISLPLALRYINDERLTRWWPQAGFADWFRNADEFRQRIEYLVHLSLDTLENVLVDQAAQASAKVNAAKLLMEVAQKMPKRAVTEMLDDAIAKMDRKQLEEYVRARTKLVSSAD